MKFRITFIFTLLLFGLHVFFVANDINNLGTVFLKNFIRIPVAVFLLFLLSKKTQFNKMVLYVWIVLVLLVGINYFFFSQRADVLYKLLFSSIGAGATYLISRYYLGLKDKPEQAQPVKKGKA